MIKIERVPAPAELTPEVVAQKTAIFKADHNQVVWREAYIIQRLLEMSHSKCCYCECRVDEESNYVEVEHFHHKDKYEDEVALWENLLPSCKKCNVHKSYWDTVTEPIIDPTKEEPKEHLAFYSFQLRGKTDMGELTVDVLNLNDAKHCLSRFKLCSQLTQTISALYDKASSMTEQTTSRSKTLLRNSVIQVLQLCQADEPYTAVKATTVLNDRKYSHIVNILKAFDLWKEPLVTLDANMKRYQLDLE